MLNKAANRFFLDMQVHFQFIQVVVIRTGSDLEVLEFCRTGFNLFAVTLFTVQCIFIMAMSRFLLKAYLV